MKPTSNMAADSFVHSTTIDDSMIEGEFSKDKSYVLITCNNKDFKELASKVISRWNLLLDTFQHDSVGQLESFTHPITEQVYVWVENFERRQRAFAAMREIHPVMEFDWRNQSWAALGTSIFEACQGSLEQHSCDTRQYRRFTDKYHTRAIIQCVDDNVNLLEAEGYDLVSCYVNVLLDNKHDFPIFSILDPWEAYKGERIDCGLYLLDNIELPFRICERRQFASTAYVEYLLENNLIDQSMILAQRKASYKVKATAMRDFAQYCVDNLDYKDARDAIIHFIGSMGSRMAEQRKCFVTDDKNILQVMFKEYCLQEGFDEYGLSKLNTKYTEIGDFHFGEIIRSSEKTLHNAPIMWHVWCGGKIRLLEMLKDIGVKGQTKIHTVNTDGILGTGFRDNIVDCALYKNKETIPLKTKAQFYNDEDWFSYIESDVGTEALLPLTKAQGAVVKKWQPLPDYHWLGDQKILIDGVEHERHIGEEQINELVKGGGFCCIG
jgi:hypothetical protein